MKVYIHYLILPENLTDKYDSNIVDDFNKVKSSLNTLERFYNDKTESWYYQYAFTDNKEYSDIFEKLHDKKMFVKKIRKMTKKEYGDFRKNNLGAELKLRAIYGYENDSMVITKNELYEVEETCNMFMNEILMEASLDEYSMYKDKYIKALDYLMYCTNNRVNGEECDYYSYQASYGITPESYAPVSISIRQNTFSLYARLYALILRKD